MRTIKFRGKRLDNGKWIEGCFAEFVHPIDGDTKPGIQVTRCVPSSIDRFMPVYETELVEVLPESVGQWTGLVDRDKVEAYEKDVVDVYFQDGDVERAVLIWDAKRFRYQLKSSERSLWGFDDTLRFKIIGNLIDSPELMEVK